ncbi:MAG: hypothetical protein DMF50_04320 [Acidobacteria bacterium]|nr:MAG: hypothetical protein DMF50_04320 [Acidobacteriota bacterium]
MEGHPRPGPAVDARRLARQQRHAVPLGPRDAGRADDLRSGRRQSGRLHRARRDRDRHPPGRPRPDVARRGGLQERRDELLLHLQADAAEGRQGDPGEVRERNDPARPAVDAPSLAVRWRYICYCAFTARSLQGVTHGTEAFVPQSHASPRGRAGRGNLPRPRIPRQDPLPRRGGQRLAAGGPTGGAHRVVQLYRDPVCGVRLRGLHDIVDQRHQHFRNRDRHGTRARRGARHRTRIRRNPRALRASTGLSGRPGPGRQHRIPRRHDRRLPSLRGCPGLGRAGPRLRGLTAARDPCVRFPQRPDEPGLRRAGGRRGARHRRSVARRGAGATRPEPLGARRAQAGGGMYEKRIPIRWRDMDGYGHVNNAVFLTYLEEARDEWLSRLLAGTGGESDYVVARIAIDYRRELKQKDESVLVRCRLDKLGTSSIRTLEEILLPDGDLCARAEVVLVMRDRAAGTSRPLTAEERAALGREGG